MLYIYRLSIEHIGSSTELGPICAYVCFPDQAEQYEQMCTERSNSRFGHAVDRSFLFRQYADDLTQAEA